MNSHARQTLDVLKELTQMFPGQDPIRTAMAFTEVSKHVASLRTIDVEARNVTSNPPLQNQAGTTGS